MIFDFSEEKLGWWIPVINKIKKIQQAIVYLKNSSLAF
jgi:hypothetical protein